MALIVRRMVVELFGVVAIVDAQKGHRWFYRAKNTSMSWAIGRSPEDLGGLGSLIPRLPGNGTRRGSRNARSRTGGDARVHQLVAGYPLGFVGCPVLCLSQGAGKERVFERASTEKPRQETEEFARQRQKLSQLAGFPLRHECRTWQLWPVVCRTGQGFRITVLTGQ